MNRCEQCGYCYADCDENGVPISLEYCHFEGPDEWAPCAASEYEGEPYDYQEF